MQIVRKGDSWKIVGYVDMGLTCNNLEIIQKKKKEVKMATHVLQFMFAGFNGFRWPVAYFGSSTATAVQIYINYNRAVDILRRHQFTVDYVMMDGASTNRLFTKMVFGDVVPREVNFQAVDIYNRRHKIAFIQDIKHVLKKIRNGISSSSSGGKTIRCLELDGRLILWDHWVKASDYNVQGGYRIHRKLTPEHIELNATGKMRNALAIEVLDSQMLNLMRLYQKTCKEPEELSCTIKLLENTSVLTDVFMDCRRPIRNCDDPRIGDLKKALAFFNNWENQVTNNAKLSNKKCLLTQETRDDLNSSILGFLEMVSTLVPKGIAIRPGYLNSDVIENFFCQQRGTQHGANTNPTLAQYGPAVNAIVLGQSTVSRKANSGVKASHYHATTPCVLNDRKHKKRPEKADSECRPVIKQPRL